VRRQQDAMGLRAVPCGESRRLHVRRLARRHPIGLEYGASFYLGRVRFFLVRSRIDGFALSIGDAPWVPHQVQNAYDAALSSSLNFKLFVSFNMSEFQDPTQVRRLPFIGQC
jgi:hypothetical protein